MSSLFPGLELGLMPYPASDIMLVTKSNNITHPFHPSLAYLFISDTNSSLDLSSRPVS